jgi:hypothetical protein
LLLQAIIELLLSLRAAPRRSLLLRKPWFNLDPDSLTVEPTLIGVDDVVVNVGVDIPTSFSFTFSLGWFQYYKTYFLLH